MPCETYRSSICTVQCCLSVLSFDILQFDISRHVKTCYTKNLAINLGESYHGDEFVYHLLSG